MLDLNQGIYEHFLRRRGDNSTIRYWLLAGRGLWEDVPEDGDKNKFQPSAWAECAGRTKTTNLHYHQEGSSGVEEIACSGGHGSVWRNQRKVPGVHVADRRNFVGRWSTEATKTTIRLCLKWFFWMQILHRPTKFLRSATRCTWNVSPISPDGDTSTIWPISAASLDPF